MVLLNFNKGGFVYHAQPTNQMTCLGCAFIGNVASCMEAPPCIINDDGEKLDTIIWVVKE
jgi:hypothetical protein